jgi:peptide/nickel transport system substrate-binding protein
MSARSQSQLGNSTSVQYSLSPLTQPTFSGDTVARTRLENAFAKGVTNPYTHNASKAKALMKANGWVGDTCAKSGAGGCGPAAFPIPKGATSAIQLLYPSGDTTVTEQVNAEVAMITTAGIDVTAKAEPVATVQSVCLGGAAEWQVCDLQGRIYAPNIHPSGGSLFATGSSSNSRGYSNPEMNKLVAATVASGGVGLN